LTSSNCCFDLAEITTLAPWAAASWAQAAPIPAEAPVIQTT